MPLNENNKSETLKFGISVEEARKQLGIGRNLMLQLVRLDGFPAIRFKRKIIINGQKLQEWFDQNYGQYGGYSYKK
jgi:hypothetical protein